MVAILAQNYPHRMMYSVMYLCTITYDEGYRSFLGDRWITYDIVYCRKAAVTESLDWNQVVFMLYNETFTGRAKSVARCCHCSSDLRSSQKCFYIPGGSMPTVNQSKTLRNSRLSVLLCGHFSADSAPASLHFCAECHSPHPQSKCHQRDLPLLNLSRKMILG